MSVIETEVDIIASNISIHFLLIAIYTSMLDKTRCCMIFIQNMRLLGVVGQYWTRLVIDSRR